MQPPIGTGENYTNETPPPLTLAILFLIGCESFEEKIERKRCVAVNGVRFQRTSITKSGYFTEISYKCEDGSYFVREYKGIWALEDFI